MTEQLNKKLPIGSSNFSKIIREDYLFIDKSLMIQEFLDSSEEVMLITRPRRWGKTLLLSMVQHFVSAKVNGQATVGLFDQLLISQVLTASGENYLAKHQGRYPVIFISFKEIKSKTAEQNLEGMYQVITELYREHRYLLHSSQLDEFDRERIKYFLYFSPDSLRNSALPSLFANALRSLCEMLAKHTGEKCYVLVDEYDTPLNSAYLNAYLPEALDFMRNLFSATFKDNPYLAKGLITGILRIAKNNLFSGLNNLKCFSVLSEKYSQYFGFTEAEVQHLLTQYAHLSINLADIRYWYNGYNIGGRQALYNPWSILNCLDEKGKFAPYWINTGDDSLIKRILRESDAKTVGQLYDLVKVGGSVEVAVHENTAYEDLFSAGDNLWTLLLMTGYLTQVSVVNEDTHQLCKLRIPNQEVLCLYRDVFETWLTQTQGRSQYASLLLSLVNGEVATFGHKLSAYLLNATSALDFTLESHYHTFLLGLLLSVTDTHDLFSNRESGLGRPDCLLIPKDKSFNKGIILEFKLYDKADKALLKYKGKQAKLADVLAKAAAIAVTQINLRGYDYALQQHPNIQQVIKIGLAFYDRSIGIAEG